jgi:hypothetical protein
MAPSAALNHAELNVKYDEEKRMPRLHCLL